MSVHPAGGHPVAAFIFRAGCTAPRARDRQEHLLERHFGGRGWLAAELLRAVRDAEDIYVDTVNRIETPSWSRGRVVLVGDSAASITILGEGCSLAIAGAGVLAESLADHSDVGAALEDYERRHRPQVVAKQRGAGLGASILVPRTTAGIAVRNTLVGLVGRV